MNTDLMLRIADEIDTHPERYDQTTGMFAPNDDARCAVCIAGQAIRMAGMALYAGNAWDEVAKQARKLLDLTAAQARGLFAEHPNSVILTTVFPHIHTHDLDTIDELRRWALGRDCILRPRADNGENSLSCTFGTFWNNEKDIGHKNEWNGSAARVMAAALRLIASGREASRKETTT